MDDRIVLATSLTGVELSLREQEQGDIIFTTPLNNADQGKLRETRPEHVVKLLARLMVEVITS